MFNLPSSGYATSRQSRTAPPKCALQTQPKNNSGSPADATYLHYKRKPLFLKKSMYVSPGDFSGRILGKKVNVFLFLHAKYANHKAHNLHTAISHLHCNEQFETFKCQKWINMEVCFHYRISQFYLYYFYFLFLILRGKNRTVNIHKEEIYTNSCLILKTYTIARYKFGILRFYKVKIIFIIFFIPWQKQASTYM